MMKFVQIEKNTTTINTDYLKEKKDVIQDQ